MIVTTPMKPMMMPNAWVALIFSLKKRMLRTARIIGFEEMMMLEFVAEVY